MAFKVQVGPPQIAIHQGQAVLVSEPDGQFMFPSDRGLFFYDTRVLTVWNIQANGVEWDLLNGGALTYDCARIFLTNRAFVTEDGQIEARSLSLVITRQMGGGMHEDIDITNFGLRPVRFNIEITIRADFADIFEVKQGSMVRRGRITTEWSSGRQRLATLYRNRDFVRSIAITADKSGSDGVYANGRLSFEVQIEPGKTWHTCLLYDLDNGERTFRAPEKCPDETESTHEAAERRDWRRRVLKLKSASDDFNHYYEQAIDDMAALRLPLPGTDHMVFVPAAGLPWFVAPFGRDSLIVSLQNILVYPEFARGALDVLGQWQAKERDDYRDAEPGKILHELRYGELAHFKLIPHTPYYGTADATPLYLVTLHAAWRATGDDSLLEQHMDHAEGCLGWIDNWGDRDGDGFQEYQTRSPAGYENMAWKDAGDAVRNPDGTLAKGPKALCELQGYVYAAWLGMAEIFDHLQDKERAAALRAKAKSLFDRFNEAFWDEESGFYAYLLDGDKKKVLTVASNPGHCLTAGIVPADRAERVVRRLLQPDMDSGWGIRTLSAAHPAFNPYSYQNGSVWPHDNSIIALGFKRYGFHAEAAHIAKSICDASSHFHMSQVPELYAGVQRADGGFPVQYLGANVPQAWAAGSAFLLVQALLGITLDAPRDRLFVDPWLPEWLPELELTDLRLGRHKLGLRFWREGGATDFKVTHGEKGLVQRRSMADEREMVRDGKADA
ncbi:MAG TPA: glycogen debranching N-terminal domain-containing protein [Acetobacteraceae bacterium]|nr:glycogen debranching N-terminal domain-containing protein [Acetobacteraceae bacterium]